MSICHNKQTRMRPRVKTGNWKWTRNSRNFSCVLFLFCTIFDANLQFLLFSELNTALVYCVFEVDRMVGHFKNISNIC